MIQIAVAEDNAFLAKSIKERISFFDDFNLKFIGKNGSELLTLLRDDHQIDVVLMDINMPVMDGITATAKVKQKYPQIKIIILTVFDDEEHIFSAIQAGADGYLLKDQNANFLYEGIKDIMAGGAPMSPSIALKTLKLLRNPMKPQTKKDEYKLTKRETEILEQLSTGLSYKEVADNLIISTGTVRKHIENTYRKLQVCNKVEAILLAKEQRII